MNNSIVIMCGGKGTRMGKLTKEIPKPLTPILGSTILELKIKNYMKQKFNNFIFCIGYKGEQIRKYIAGKGFPINISFSDSGLNAGILKRLYDVKDLVDQTILMTYGDTYSDINLYNLLQSHKNSNHDVTIVVASFTSPFGLIEFGAGSTVTYFEEKPNLKYYIGYAAIKKSVLEEIPEEIPEEFGKNSGGVRGLSFRHLGKNLSLKKTQF